MPATGAGVDRGVGRLAASFLIAALAGVACAPAKPAVTPTPVVGQTAKEVPPPADDGPNVLRDRRAEPGVRRAPTALLLDPRATRPPTCGKLGPILAPHGRQERDARTDRAESAHDLLAGRLTIGVPPAARAPMEETRGSSAEIESRIVVETGKEAMAIVAKETFQLDPDRWVVTGRDVKAPGTLDVEATKYLRATYRDEPELTITPVAIAQPNGPPLRAYAARPKEPNAPPGKDTALALALLLEHTDGTLQSVAFYVRGEFVRNATGSALVGCTRAAEHIAATLRPGARTLERAAGKRTIAPLPSGGALTMNVLSDYVVITTPTGATVHKLRPLSLFAGSIAVALGDSRPASTDDGASETARGTLLGRNIEWRTKRSVKSDLYVASLPLDPSDAGKRSAPSAEVLVTSSRHAAAIDELRAVAETLALSTANGKAH